MSSTTRPARNRTWSLFGDVKRRPTPYEAVTGKFHYHIRRDPAPFELDPGWTLNQWYLTHREGSPMQVEDWEQFRDPARLTYKDYVSLQHEREIYVDALVDSYEGDEYVQGLSAEWVATLRESLVPLRFPLHGLQMAALYVGQMAPSSYITNCAHFQAADEMRRIQRIAYWTRVLADNHGDEIASTDAARTLWETDERWQPLREAVETMLIAYDWGEAFAALNLAVKPALDAAVARLGETAAANGDRFLEALCAEFALDSARSAAWTSALVDYTRERSADAAAAVDGWAATWRPKGEAAAAAWATTFGG